MRHPSSAPAPGVRSALLADHDSIDAALDRLLEALSANDRSIVPLLFSDLESKLLAHMEAEERLLVPVLRRTHATDARAILQEHVHFRSRLAQLGTSVELHTARLATARALASELRAHARHEDRLLYRVVDEQLDAAERASILSALENSPRGT